MSTRALDDMLRGYLDERVAREELESRVADLEAGIRRVLAEVETREQAFKQSGVSDAYHNCAWMLRALVGDETTRDEATR